ncbi:hypothetical protein V1512DRAFT_202220 [Lipomyces arxii]|uniref:uncharacterized protein n=1 Tax=Lipomyces arxii TaxID=56418 RepID=UPI0034CEED53
MAARNAPGVAAQAQPKFPFTAPPLRFSTGPGGPGVPGGFPMPPMPMPGMPPGMPMPMPMPGMRMPMHMQMNGSGSAPQFVSQQDQQDSLTGPPKSSSFLTDTNLRQPTGEEQIRTIFVGSIPAELDDFWLARIIKASGPVAGWIRMRDALGKPKNFALVEFLDAKALTQGFQSLSSIEIPVVEVEEGEEVEDLSQAERTGVKLNVTCAESTKDLIDSQQVDNYVVEQGRKAAQDLLNIWKDPVARKEEHDKAIERGEPDENAQDQNPDYIRGIALGGDDELLDFPPEQREIVLKEIVAFRERATQRERERIKREEELERQRLERIQAQKRQASLASESQVDQTMATRMREVEALSSAKDSSRGKEELDDGPDDISDEALEERRRDKREDELEARFIERERRYIRNEKSRITSAERDMRREHDEQERYQRTRTSMLRVLDEWDDEVEAERRIDEYYRDRSIWLRNRAAFRSREADNDARDAAAEQPSNMFSDLQRDASAATDSFLENLSPALENGSRESSIAPREFKQSGSGHDTKKEELRRAAEPIRMSFNKEEAAKPISIGFSSKLASAASAPPSKFKLALGSKKPEASAKKPAEVKTVLDDEEEVEDRKRRKLIPLSYDK